MDSISLRLGAMTNLVMVESNFSQWLQVQIQHTAIGQRLILRQKRMTALGLYKMMLNQNQDVGP